MKKTTLGDNWIPLAKTITWRIIATGTTTVIAYIITGEISSALVIGGYEAVLKMVFYFLHEKAWSAATDGKAPPH